jgi:hypothetical protein
VVVSSYFSHLHSHPEQEWLIAIRETLRALSKDEGIQFELEQSGWLFSSLEQWDYGREEILELKMEELIQRPEELIAEACRFIGLVADDSRPPDEPNPDSGGISTSKLVEIVRSHGFSVKSGGREPGQEDVHSHYRKGVPGDWGNHFTEQHREWFKRNLGGLLVKLGYEKDEGW